jgi:hypothetical protein
LIERGKKMGKTNDGIGNGYGKLQGADDAPVQLWFEVEPDPDEEDSRALARYDSHVEDLGLSVSDVHIGDITPNPCVMMAEGTVAQIGALLDAFSPDSASWEGDVYMYFDHTPNKGVRGSFDSTKPIEYENAALDAIRKRHDSENGGILMGIYTGVA